MLVVVVIVGAISVGANCHGPQVEIFECPDTPDELFDSFGDLPPEWQDWYLQEYDPHCEGLAAAADAGS